MQHAADHEIVQKEYDHLQAIVTSFNETATEVKKWGVTFSLAALGLAYTQHTSELLLVSLGSAVAFWLTEAYWRANQRVFIQRIREIEALPPGQKIESPFISSHFKKNWDDQLFCQPLRTIGSLFTLRTALPHALIVLAAIMLMVCHPPGPPPPGSARDASLEGIPEP